MKNSLHMVKSAQYMIVPISLYNDKTTTYEEVMTSII